MKTDDKKANSKTTENNKRTSVKDDLASKKPAYKKPEEDKKKEEQPEAEEIKKTPQHKAIELDEDIRNDIEQTEVNPHVKRRSPLHNVNHAIDPEEVNEDQRIVNHNNDSEGTNKYNSL